MPEPIDIEQLTAINYGIERFREEYEDLEKNVHIEDAVRAGLHAVWASVPRLAPAQIAAIEKALHVAAKTNEDADAEMFELDVWNTLRRLAGASSDEAVEKQIGIACADPCGDELTSSSYPAGRPESPPTRLLVVWARMEGETASSPYAQFVAAFPEGMVECWGPVYRERRTEAEQFFRDFFDDEPTEFFETWEEFQRPPSPTSPIERGGSS